MLRIILSLLVSVSSLSVGARTITVANAAALKIANSEALPGDTLVLQNGEWKDLTILLNCKGTAAAPIVVKAQTPGKVLISGHSVLRIGGSYIIVDGLYFVNGYSGNDAAITFRSNKTEVANNCRVTNTVINSFNNPKRLNENYWVALYGKNNRIDHCSFFDKKNIGVLLAVILDDERSRANFHSIDHNYFGVRVPLASNGGEIIRVGVSEHCQYNSNTQITDNFFEHCDGETEIISIKSCQNTVRNNLFKECQGSVVLRHGNYNTVESNVFWGNDKKGTGGVRIINKGQWVVNNFFYKCRGEGFRSPLSIMNGIPNSPANRYLEVSEAVIANNSFYECSPIGLCVGSDAERSVQPYHVKFLNNLFYNIKDSQLYQAYDDISRISFTGNLVGKTSQQRLASGFVKTPLSVSMQDGVLFPAYKGNQQYFVSDSLQKTATQRLGTLLSSLPGLMDARQLSKVKINATNACGAKWLTQLQKPLPPKAVAVNCKNASELLQQLTANTKGKLTINLTGTNYIVNTPLHIGNDVTITTSQKQAIQFSSPATDTGYLIQIKAGGKLTFANLSLNLAAINANTFITSDTTGSSHHYHFSMNNCLITNCNSHFFIAAKSSVADSIMVNNCSFNNGKGNLFQMVQETDKKGYYNVEQLKITNCSVTNYTGQLLAILRSGNDESTMGPMLTFWGNRLNNCATANEAALINLFGVQNSVIEKNTFLNCNAGKKLIQYEDVVSAVHFFRKNKLAKCGAIITDKYVVAEY